MRQRIGFVEVLSGIASISDATLPYDAQVTTAVPTGTLSVEIEVSSEGGGIECVRCASGAGERGDLVGRVGSFFGQIVVCDRPLGESIFGEPSSDLRAEYNKGLDRPEAAFAFDVRGVWFLAVRPVEGGGEYSVYAVIDAEGQPVGFEIDMTAELNVIEST